MINNGLIVFILTVKEGKDGMKKALVEIVGLMGLAMLMGCSSTNIDPADWDPIVFGVSPDYPPLVLVSEEGAFDGYEVELAKRVAYKLKRKPVFEEIPLTELQSALLDEDVDVVIGGIAKYHSRASVWAFSDTVLNAGQMAIIRESDAEKYTDVSELKGLKTLRVGVEAGSAGDDLAQVIFSEGAVVRCASSEDGLTRLKLKEIDILIHDAPTAWTCSDPSLVPLIKPLSVQPYAWAVRPDDVILLEDVNDAFIILNHRGEIKTMKHKWIPNGKEEVVE